MTQRDRVQFLFGNEIDPETADLDDPDVRAELLERRSSAEVPAVQLATREVIASQILQDDPPETWVTAQRLAAEGLDDAKIVGQLALALVPSIQAAVGDGSADGKPFDRDGYVEALERLPLPEAEEVEDLIIDTVRSRQRLEIEDMEDSVAAQLGGRSPVIDLLLDKVVDHLLRTDAGIRLLPGDRVIETRSLTEGIVLTHRLTDAERAVGSLSASFDLAGFRDRPALHLGSDERIEASSVERGHLAWRPPDGWLDQFEPGDLLCVRVAGDGQVTIEVLDEEPAPDAALVNRLRAVYDETVSEPRLPVSALDLLFGVLAEDPTTFSHPRLPLAEVAEHAGLERRQDEVAHDASVWYAGTTSRRQWRVLSRLDDLELAEPVIAVLGAADLSSGIDRDLVAAVHEIPDDPALAELVGEMGPESLDVLMAELFDEIEQVPETRGSDFAALLVDIAHRPKATATAHLVAAISREREPDAPAAEKHLEAGHLADPDNVMITDRLAWYASDRGDAARAKRLWRECLVHGDVSRDLAEVDRNAEPAHRQLGRNDPCWCGSGRKFKQCHLGSQELPLADRVGWLRRKAVAYLERRGGTEEDVTDIAMARASDPTDEESVQDAFDDPLVMDLALTEGRWFRSFLSERGELLPEDELQLASSWLLVERTVYEVVTVDPGVGLVLRDLRTGDELSVREAAFSSDARKGMAICGRAVPDGETHQFMGGLVPVRVGMESELLELLDQADPVAIAERVADLGLAPVSADQDDELLGH